MKYESELIKEIVDTKGHEKSLLHYDSECIESWIDEAKGAYPKLTDYRGEWLNYMVESPIGEFPYISLSDVTNATVDNVVPYAYKSAILKGDTKYRDIDTGDILDTFNETKNLELVSVKMPVLTTTGKNLFDGKLEYGLINNNTGLPTKSNDYVRSQNFIPINCEKITFTVINGECGLSLYFYDKDKKFISYKTKIKVSDDLSIPDGVAYLKFRTYPISDESTTNNLNTQIQIEKGKVATEYEPYQSNILTVNEEVTLRSNGDICDELNLLTGQLTQRIGEDGVVLSQEVVKTVDLLITNQDGNTLSKIKPIEGTMHLATSSGTLKPTFSGEIPVEATTQNLASFIGE